MMSSLYCFVISWSMVAGNPRPIAPNVDGAEAQKAIRNDLRGQRNQERLAGIVEIGILLEKTERIHVAEIVHNLWTPLLSFSKDSITASNGRHEEDK